jgi:abortive infection bacteriophage resistance protein
VKFQKPALSIPDLAQRWLDRGLSIADPAEAAHYLRFIGYYRLSAYALPLQDKAVPSSGSIDKPFKTGVSFTDILNLYRFDRELRLLFIDAIERIEVAVRTCIVNEMCLRHGPHWFMDAGHFKPAAPRFKHHRLLDRIDQELQIPNGAKSPSKPHHEVFINHYYAAYTDPYLPPAWMIAETLTLGAWSLIFENLRDTNERKRIAQSLQTDEQVLRNWLHALTYLRNLCAHHSRLWNRQFVIKPMIAKRHAKFLRSNDRCYAMAVVVEDLLRTVAPGTSWALRLRNLLSVHPFIDPAAMGFPMNWEEEAFWNFTPTP